MQETKHKFQITKSTNFDTNFGTKTSWVDQHGNNNPQSIFDQNPQYKKLFNQFVGNNARMNAITNSSNEKKEHSAIKLFISKSLSMRKKEDQFKQKFGSQCKVLKKKHKNNLINQMNAINHKIGQTKQQKGLQNKNLFFSQTRKVIQLQEQCMLLEYYYKDKKQIPNRSKTIATNVNINYLRNRDHDQSKHSRFQHNNQQRDKLYLAHNQLYFDKIKKNNYLKQQKFKTQSFRKAQLNYAFKRQNNFAQMEQIIKQNRQNLILQSNQHLNPEQVRQQQHKFNKSLRLFLKFAHIQQSKRSYYEYIDNQGIQIFTQFIVQNQFSIKLNQNKVKQMIKEIIKDKVQNRMELYDIIQFFDTANQLYQIDLLSLIRQKNPECFVRNQQKIVYKFMPFRNQNFLQIKKQVNSKKFKLVLKLIFQSNGKLVLNQYLPIKYIPQILSNFGISGNDIPIEKIFQFSLWNQKRQQGLKFSQFFFSFLMLGVKNDKWQHIFKLLQKIKVNQLLK